MSQKQNKFATAYNPRPLIPSPAGEKVYTYQVMEGGKIIEKEWQIFDEIQSYEHDCLVSTIIEKFEDTGDFSLLNTHKGIYEDITGLPSDLMEVIESARSIENGSSVPAPVLNEETVSPKDGEKKTEKGEKTDSEDSKKTDKGEKQ